MTEPGGAAAAQRSTMPEFTRSLRGFAAVKALGTKEHELVFGPLIAARRSAARVPAPEARAAAFDAVRLRKALRETIATIAKARNAGNAAQGRAYEARLEERAAPVFAALTAVADATAALKVASPADKPGRWAAWCDAVQSLFDSTDGFWLAIDDAAPPPPGVARLLVALISAGTLLLGAMPIQAQQFGQRPREVVRVEGIRLDSLVRAGFDVIGVEGAATLVVATPRDRERLATLGSRLSAVGSPRLAADQVAPTVYRSYDDPVRGIRKWVDSLVAANPRVSVDTIGRSFENRPMLMLKVGTKGDSPQRPNVLFIATYHAREWAATEMAQRLVKWLAAPPGTDARRDSLVQTRDIYVMPVANPDGYQYTFTSDRLWRKTRAPQVGGQIGADMNRNHSVNWGLDNQGSSPDASSEIYRGPTAASEVETRNIEAFHAAHPPVAAVSYHTFAGLILYPVGSSYGKLPADLPVYRTLAGTHLRSAITDRLPFSIRTQYAPGPGWQLYTTNGEYTDFASTRHASLAFTTEITSGYGPAGFYGFEFPDDETLLERVFQDNLPFALDLLDAARDPIAFRSASTGLISERLVVERMTPDVAVTVPAELAPSAKLFVPGAAPFRIDSMAGGKYTRRLISLVGGRPALLRVVAGDISASFRALHYSGAEETDEQWAMVGGFGRDTVIRHSGQFSFLGTNGTLTTPAVSVPADADTVSLVYWTIHFGSGFTPEPSGRIEASSDGGATWTTVLVQRSSAPDWYTDRAVVGGVRNKSVRFRFTTVGMTWRIDNAAIIAHGPVTSAGTTVAASIRPSENPVRSGTVRFNWPFGVEGGDLTVLDFAGRRVWSRKVVAGEVSTWDVESSRVANGVYVVVARAGKQTSRLKLFVARSRE
jgi:hypothetical protein